jgi:hypothetical protein
MLSHPCSIRSGSIGLAVVLTALLVVSLSAQPLPAPGNVEGRGEPAHVREFRANGGNVQAGASIAAGLKWLLRHQAQDGHWSLDRFHEHGLCNCTGAGDPDDLAATALGLLPLLAAGETHKGAGKNNLYAKNVERGLKYLIFRQGDDGRLGDTLLGHALATLALCESYGLTADPILKRPAQKALDFLIAAQNADGSWSERKGGDASRPITDDSMMVASLVPLGDLFPRASNGRDVYLFGWHMTALRSGRMAGLAVPNATFQKCNEFLDGLASEESSRYAAFRGGNATPASTACGLMCRQFLGIGRRNPGMANGVEYLLKESAPESLDTIRHGFHTTRVLHSMDGESWEKWHPKMRDRLIESQDFGLNPDHRDQKGSWPPDKDAHGKTSGRLMITSLSLLTLETYYYAPVHRREGGAMKDPAIRDAAK